MTVGNLEGIEHTGTIRHGSKDSWVKDIQWFFKDIGYKLEVDGIFGKMTCLVVEDFQRHCDLKSDGIIGSKTKSAMLKYDGGDYEFCHEIFESIKPYKLYKNEQIESLMQPLLIGFGCVFNYNAKINDFDVLHSIAHSVLEASYKGLWANSAIARKKNNIYGFGAYDLSPFSNAKKFMNKAECIQIWSKWWNENYLLETGKFYNGCNEQGVNVKYATSPIAGINKSFIVRELRRKLK